MTGNPNWKKGGPSPNPSGRQKTKYSIRTPKGMIENFIKKNLTYRKLQRMFDELDSKDQFKVLTEMLPYVMPKQNSLTADINFEALSDRDLDKLYQRVTENISYEIVPQIDLSVLTDDELETMAKIQNKVTNVPTLDYNTR